MDSKINLEHALGQFKNYISAYDENDPKINLPEEKRKLAELIGLLHDIGRFEQLRLTNSFDDSVIPHAKCSLMVLFDQRHLRDFIETKEYDAIIYESIKNHGVFLVDENLKDEELLFTKIIRDGDKLDNFHTKLIESMETRIMLMRHLWMGGPC